MEWRGCHGHLLSCFPLHGLFEDSHIIPRAVKSRVILDFIFAAYLKAVVILTLTEMHLTDLVLRMGSEYSLLSLSLHRTFRPHHNLLEVTPPPYELS